MLLSPGCQNAPPGHGHDTVMVDCIKPMVLEMENPPVLPRAHPHGCPPLQPRPPPSVNAPCHQEQHYPLPPPATGPFQEAPNPLSPTCPAPRPLCIISAPPRHVQPHRAARKHLANLSSEPLLKYFIIRNFTHFVAACNLGVWAQSLFSDQ